jgi:hypothetical protein
MALFVSTKCVRAGPSPRLVVCTQPSRCLVPVDVPCAASPLQGWASRLCFLWVSPLLERGSVRAQLQPCDLFALEPDLEPAACSRRLWTQWTMVRTDGTDGCMHRTVDAGSAEHVMGK